MEPQPPQAAESLRALGMHYRLIKDEETARYIHGLGWSVQDGSPFRCIREASFEDTLETYLRATKPWEDSLALMGFFDVKSGDLLGSVLLSIGPLWYNQEKLGVYELCLTSTPQGSGRGIARATAVVLKGFVESGMAAVAEAGSAMSSNPTQLENAYRKAGFSTFKSFVMETHADGRS